MNERAKETLRVGAFLVRPDLGEIVGPSGVSRVEPKVIDLLLVLAERPGSVVLREELLKCVWGDVVVSEDALTAAVSKLRRALSDDDRTVIETIPKRGYRLTVSVETEVSEQPSHVAGIPMAGRLAARLSPAWIAGAVAAVIIVAVAIIPTLRRAPSPGKSPTSPPRPLTSLPGIESAAAPAPNGTRVVFTRVDGDLAHLYVTDGESPPSPLTRGHVYDHSSVWSPDGSRIAFLRSRSDADGVYVVPASGGAPKPIVSVPRRLGPGLDWSPDGARLAYASGAAEDQPTAIRVVELEAHASRTATAPPSGIWGDRYPRFSPNGDEIAFVRTTTLGVSEIHVVSVNGGAGRRVLQVDGMIDGIDWLDPARLVFASNHTGAWALFAAHLRDGDYDPFGGLGLQGRFPMVSDDGSRLIYTLHRSRADIWRLRIGADPDAWREDAPVISSSFWDSTPQLSPDGQHIAWSSNRSGRVEVWTANADGTRARKVTGLESAFSSAPRWSPDGGSLAFDTRIGGRAQVFVVNIDNGSSRSVGSPHADNMLPTWSRDGQHLYFNEHRGEKRALVRCPLDGGPPVVMAQGRALLATEGLDGDVFYVDTNAGALLMRRAADGRIDSTLVLAPGQWGNWERFDDAVYYVADLEDGRVGIVRRALDSDEETMVARCDTELENLAFDVSADQRWLLIAPVIEDESDVMELTLR